jgi:hypothetical protein
VKNDYGTEQEAWALNELEELLKKERYKVQRTFVQYIQRTGKVSEEQSCAGPHKDVTRTRAMTSEVRGYCTEQF